MAKNYTISEAAQIMVAGTDREAIADIGKRYPLLAIKLVTVGTKAGKDFVDLMGYMPDYLTANKVNKAIKEEYSGDEAEAEDGDEVEDEADAEEEVADKKQPKAKKVATKKDADVDTSDTDYANMNNAKLYKLLGDYGERKACKAEFGDLSKASMISYLTKHHGDGTAAEDEAEEDWEEDKQEDKYADMSAQELFKECKKRGIKAAPKKSTKFYIDLLKKADAEAEAAEDEAEDDDWEDDDVEEEEPPKKAPAKKAAAKPAKKAVPAKKAAKKPEPEEDADDDDDDWDI